MAREFDKDMRTSWTAWSKELLKENNLSSSTYSKPDGTVVVKVADLDLGYFLKELYRAREVKKLPVILTPLSSNNPAIQIKQFAQISDVQEIIPLKHRIIPVEKIWIALSIHKRAVALAYSNIQIATKVVEPDTDFIKYYKESYESYKHAAGEDY